MSAGLTRSKEQRLIARAAAGDRDAADALIRAHQGPVYGYILRLCGRADVVEDVVQEAFVRVLTNLDRYDMQFRFSTWLFTIARRVFLNAIERRRPVYDTDHLQGVDVKDEPVGAELEDSEAHEACRDVVQRALMEVTGDQREILILFHQCEWPIRLIADHLHLPEGTVKSHLHRGRQRLRAALEKIGARGLMASFEGGGES